MTDYKEKFDRWTKKASEKFEEIDAQLGLKDRIEGGAKAVYDAASVLTYADRLKGRLLLYYGTADNNVHPNNAMQLIQALQKAGKSFEVQVGPDLGHSAVNRERMMEFFIQNLVLAR